MDLKVFKAFLYDLLTSIVTLVTAYLAVPDNVSKLGVADMFVPIVVGIAGAVAIAARRYLIERQV